MIAGVPDIGEGGDRVFEEHYAKAREDHVITLWFKSVGLRICLDKLNRAVFSRQVTRNGQHGFGDIDSGYRAFCSNPLGEA